MKLAAKNLISLGALGVMALVVGVTGCKSSSDHTTGQAISDRLTAHDVHKALAKAPMYKYTDVKANVYNGNVQLTGFVESEDQRKQAAEIVASVPGVQQVVNEIMIKPTPTGRATIRDPLGRETGQVMIDTNSPPAKPQTEPAQTQPNTQGSPSNP